MLQFQIALQDLLDVLANQQLAEVLQVGQTLQKQHALDERVGVLHFGDRFMMLVVLEFRHAPVPQHPRMQEVLVDGRQLVLQDGVETLDDSGITFHEICSALGFWSSGKLSIKDEIPMRDGLRLYRYRGTDDRGTTTSTTSVEMVYATASANVKVG